MIVDQKNTEDAGRRATAVFNSITGASFYGFHFKSVLIGDPEALAAAEKLAERLQAAGVKGARLELTPEDPPR